MTFMRFTVPSDEVRSDPRVAAGGSVPDRRRSVARLVHPVRHASAISTARLMRSSATLLGMNPYTRNHLQVAPPKSIS